MASSIVPMWLNGLEVGGSYEFDVYSPLSGSLLSHAAGALEDDALRAAQGCQDAFAAWSSTSFSRRRDIFLKAAELFSARKEECWRVLHEETAAAREFFEITFQQAVDMCKDVAGRIQTIAGSAPRSEDENRHALVVKVPYGVVLGIAPWNAPFVLGLRACIQPIACGNTVVLKGPELAPRTFWIIASVLHQAGLPAGVLNTLYHRPEEASRVTNTLIKSPMIKKITFTGSSSVGALIASTAGRYLKPVLLELGGKAPAIILPDADLDRAAHCCALGAFLHSGQICMSTERVIVHRIVEQEFLGKLKERIDQLFESSNKQQPLVTQKSHKRNAALIQDALSKGAELISKGDFEIQQNEVSTLKPVVLGSVNRDMEIFYAESFGPLVSILIAESDEQCLELANDTEYGLTAAVFTEDLRRGLRIADQLATGAVHINGMTVHDENSLPHGGVKSSGYGRNNGDEGLNEWLQTKTVTWLK